MVRGVVWLRHRYCVMTANSRAHKVKHHQATLRDNSMKTCLLFGLTLSVAAGCSSSYYVADESAWHTYSLAQMNEIAKNQSVTISTIHGEVTDAADLSVRGDSTTFLQSTSQHRITIPSTSVETIAIDNVGAGAIDGLVLGALIGIPIGLLLGSAAASLEDNGDDFDWAVVAGSVGVAGIVGAGVGALIGHTDEYSFQSNIKSSQKEK